MIVIGGMGAAAVRLNKANRIRDGMLTGRSACAFAGIETARFMLAPERLTLGFKVRERILNTIAGLVKVRQCILFCLSHMRDSVFDGSEQEPAIYR